MSSEPLTVGEAADLPTSITALLGLARLFVMSVAVAAVVVGPRPAAAAEGPTGFISTLGSQALDV